MFLVGLIFGISLPFCIKLSEQRQGTKEGPTTDLSRTYSRASSLRDPRSFLENPREWDRLGELSPSAITALLDELAGELDLAAVDFNLVEGLMLRLLEESPEDFWAWWSERRFPFMNYQITDAVFDRWFELDPIQAARASLKLPTMVPWIVGRQMKVLAETDSAAALEIADQAKARGSNMVGHGVFLHLAKKDLNAAVSLAMKRPTSQEVREVLTEIGRDCSPNQFASFLEVLRKQNVSPMVLAQVAQQFYDKHGRKLLDEDPKQLLTGPLSGIGGAPLWLRKSAAQAWARKSPQEALAWVETQPNGPLENEIRGRALAAMVNAGDLNIDQALSQSPSVGSQALIARGYSQSVASRTGLEEALAWAQTIDNSTVATAAVDGALVTLARREPAAVFEYLGQNWRASRDSIRALRQSWHALGSNRERQDELWSLLPPESQDALRPFINP